MYISHHRLARLAKMSFEEISDRSFVFFFFCFFFIYSESGSDVRFKYHYVEGGRKDRPCAGDAYLFIVSCFENAP